uniref:Uncharacterized protein n=1 Tax=Anopheles atroparvus TaxID=41427 RepID=A0A182JF77_ANOAO
MKVFAWIVPMWLSFTNSSSTLFGTFIGPRSLVVVAERLDVVPVDVQPLEVARDERVVEPHQVVLGQVEPQQRGQRREDAVYVGEEVPVQPDRLDVQVLVERAALDVLHAVLRQVEHGQARQIGEHADRDVFDLVVDHPQPGQLVEVSERPVLDARDLILAQVERPQHRQVADRVRHLGQLVRAEVELLQVRAVAEHVRLDDADQVVVERQLRQHEQPVEQPVVERVQPVLGQVERVQVVHRQKRVVLDVADRVVAQVEDLQEVQLLERLRVDAGERVVRQVEHDQPDQPGERPVVDVVRRQLVAREVQHEQLLQPVKQAAGQLVDLVALQVNLAEVARPREHTARQRLQVVVAQVERPQRGQPGQGVPVHLGDVVVLQVEVLQAPQLRHAPVLRHRPQLVVRQVERLQLRPAGAALLRQPERLGRPEPVVGEVQHLQPRQRTQEAVRQRADIVVAQVERLQLLEPPHRAGLQLQHLARAPLLRVFTASFFSAVSPSKAPSGSCSSLHDSSRSSPSPASRAKLFRGSWLSNRISSLHWMSSRDVPSAPCRSSPVRSRVRSRHTTLVFSYSHVHWEPRTAPVSIASITTTTTTGVTGSVIMKVLLLRCSIAGSVIEGYLSTS